MHEDEDIDRQRWWVSALVIFGVWSIPALLFTSVRIIEARLRGSDESYLKIFLSSSVSWYIWGLLTPVILWLGRRYPLTDAAWKGRIALHSAGGVGVGLAYVFSAITLGSLIDPRFLAERGFGALFLQFLAFGLPLSLIIYGAIVGFANAFDASRKLRLRALHSSRIEAQLVHARLHALQAQLQPHFLFNALNSISSLIRQQENDRAVRMVARLSDLLRRMLASTSDTRIPLEQELDLLEDYLGIQQERFGDRLSVEIEVEPDLERARVPTLILQPLVENAIKHGVAPTSQRCAVRVLIRRVADSLCLSVQNNGAPVTGEELPSPGIGLTNTRERLQQLYPDRHELSVRSDGSGGTTASVTIPFELEAETP